MNAANRHRSMPKALFLQIRLKWFAQLRRHFLNPKRPHHAFFSFASILALVMVLGAPWILLRLPELQYLHEQIKPDLAAVSLLLFLLAVPNLVVHSSDGIYFNRSEIELLFPAPFSRRALVVYKIGSHVPVVALNALLVSVWLFPFLPRWVAVYAGVLLAALFIELLRTGTILARLILVERTYLRSRKFVLRTGLVLFGLALWPCLFRGTAGGWAEKLHQFRDSWAGMVLLTPFDAFSHVIVADAWHSVAGWAGAALLVDGVLLTLIAWLDASYSEAIVLQSQRDYDRLEKRDRDTSVTGENLRKHPWQLKPFGYCCGAGPIAWRQLMAALRSTRLESWLLWLACIAAAAFVTLGLSHAKQQQMIDGAGVLEPVFAVLVLIGVGARGISTFACDFRCDIKRIDALKMLPCPPLAIAAGELFAPLILASVGTFLYAGSVAVIEPRLCWLMLALLLFAPSLNLFHAGYENIMALLFPQLQQEKNPGGMYGDIRTLAILCLKYTLYLILIGFMLIAGAMFYLWTNRSWVAFGVAVWVVITTVALSLVPFIADAFARFDPSRDVPP